MSLKSKASQLQRFAVAVLIAVLLAAFIPTKVTPAQASTLASFTLEECDQVEASTLRDELYDITQAVFDEEQGGLDIAATVNRNWHVLNLDATVDEAVAAATEQVKEETGYWDIIISGWDAEKAKELTKIVASRAFTSTILSDAMNQLSQSISDDVVEEIQVITARSASSALLCVQAFIGDSYSPTMSAVLAKDIQSKLEETDNPTDEEIDFLDLAKSKPHLLGGVGVIVVSQLAKSLGKKLAQSIAGKVIVRVLGKIGATLVPVVGWIVGVGLIVWDLWKAREGSLPQIRDALQDEEVKQEFRKHVAQQVNKELRPELVKLAHDIANEVYEEWQEFRRKYARVLELAENHTRFRNLLDNTAVEEVQKLAKFATSIEDRFGWERLKEMVDSGHFQRLLFLPKEALDILEVVDDPEEAIDWADLAGGLLLGVIDTELYRVSSPADFRDHADLERVLALNDATFVQKAMLLEREARDSVLALPSTRIAQILDALSDKDLTWLAEDYLSVLDERKRNVLVERILRQPEIKAELNSGIVRRALLASNDFEGSLIHVGQRTGGRSSIAKVVDMLSAIGPSLLGELPFSLFWHFDGRILINFLFVFAGLIALYIVWRRVFPSRQQQVNVNLVLPKNQGGVETDSNTERIESRNDEEET